MPIDAYALCPGGTGKKVKFCCGNQFLPELERIYRMLEGDQRSACLSHVGGLLEKPEHKDRACLLALRGLLLRQQGELEAAVENARVFLEKHPDNPTAQAEAAIVTAVDRGGQAAMPLLQRAIELSDGRIDPRVYDAVGTLAEVLLSEGHWAAGRALLHLQALATRDEETSRAEVPVAMLMDLDHSGAVPLPLRGHALLPPVLEGVPWEEPYENAVKPLEMGQWQVAADRLAALAGEFPDVPQIWQSLGTVRAWLADEPGAVEALRRYASLDVPLEDAVEAENLVLWLVDDPLGDMTDVLNVTWTVADEQRVHEALLSDARVTVVPFDPAALAEGESPPPKLVGWLLDRPTPASVEGLSLDTVSRIIGELMLFGRQTDREARLEIVGVPGDDVPLIERALAEIAGDGAMVGQAQQDVIGHVSATHEAMQVKWRLPAGTDEARRDALIDQQQRKFFLEVWPERNLGLLDGRTPAEAAGEPQRRVRLLAAIILLEQWNEPSSRRFDFNLVRSRLGLPTLEPIDPETLDERQLADLPLVRLPRLVAEKLSDADLQACFGRAATFGVRDALRNFGREIVRRPSLQGASARLRAFELLTRDAESSDQAVEYIDQGRRESLSQGWSCAFFDLLDLSQRFGRREGEEAIRLMQHIEREHMEEPGVAEAFQHLLIRVGILRPDGTPANLRAREPAAVGEPQAAEPGRLWTPESQQRGPGGGKIWTPD